MGSKLLVHFLWAGLAAALSKIKVNPETNMMVDENGFTRTFHGVNVVEKLRPFLPSTEGFDLERSLGEQDFELLGSWGMNVVRLGVLWQAAVPTADVSGTGIVNQTYLDGAKKLVQRLADRGIYTIVDAHQDNLNPRTCGEGIPTWAYDQALELVGFNRKSALRFPRPLPYKIPMDEEGFPDIEKCQNYQFFTEGMTFQNNAAWNALYTRPEMAGHFAQFWGAVAKTFAGEPGVLGYELLNEPWISSKGRFNDEKSLSGLYSAASAAIREHDTTTIVMFEPIVLNQYMDIVIPWKKASFPAGGIEGPEHADRQLFAYHVYCAPFNGTKAKKVPKMCQMILNRAWKAQKKALDRVALGGFMTEFGSVGDDPVSNQVLESVAASAEEMLQSWTYWTYKGFDDITTQNSDTETFFFPDGSLQLNKIRTLARPYAPSVQGIPTTATYNNDTATFNLTYTAADVVEGAADGTRVFTSSKLHYPNGYLVFASPADGVSWKQDGEYIVVSHNSSLPAQAEVNVIIMPKNP